MLRRLLTVLIALSVLLPQGACICDFALRCEACADCTVRPEPEKPACGCRKHQRTESERATAATIVRSHTCHQSSPTDKQEDHVPACPVKKGPAVWPGDQSPCSLLVLLDLTSLLPTAEIPVLDPVPLAPTAPLATPGQPIYLTTLALLI